MLPAIVQLPEDSSTVSQYAWATTRCVVIFHELWEYAVNSHASGVAMENIIRALRGQPARTGHCKLPDNGSGSFRVLVEIDGHSERYILRLEANEPATHKTKQHGRAQCHYQ